MCGITGFFFSKNTRALDKSIVEESVALLEHRGPDDVGVWMNSQVGLGSRRLAIQDLSDNGAQPMHSQDGRYIIVYNGEVYNFHNLRNDLTASGEKLHTLSDTEVVLKLFEVCGSACLSKLNGMFAIAIYDNLEKKLFLARDRFGIKPLYLFKTPNSIFFCSEIKGFFPYVRVGGYDWEMNSDSLEEYLLYRHVTGNETLLKNVHVLPPGGWMEIDETGHIEENRYYDLDAETEIAADHGQRSFEDSLEIAHSALVESVGLRTISDAPIGVALSGGVDSSIVAAIAREKCSDDLRTYSVVFEQTHEDDRQIDESPHSRYVADVLKSDHTEILLNEELFLDNYLKCVWHNDEPLHFPNAIGKYVLCKGASHDVKVLLGGDGGDEVFAGYPEFLTNKINRSTMSYCRIEDIREICEIGSYGIPHRDKIIANTNFSGTNKTTNYLLHTYFQGHENLLDKMSMAANVELRVPFIDHNVVQASLNIPDKFKLQGGDTKALLKVIGTRYFSHEHIHRPKVGFSVPLNSWLRNDKHIGQYVHLLDEERFLQRPFVKRQGVKDLLHRFRSGDSAFKYSVPGRIWILMNLELWIRCFIEEKNPL